MIISSRKNNDKHDELDIIKPMIEKLNEQWFDKGDFIWAGRFDDGKTSMAIFDSTEEKARRYYEKYSKICADSLNINLYQWNALPLFTILERVQGKL